MFIDLITGSLDTVNIIYSLTMKAICKRNLKTFGPWKLKLEHENQKSIIFQINIIMGITLEP